MDAPHNFLRVPRAYDAPLRRHVLACLAGICLPGRQGALPADLGGLVAGYVRDDLFYAQRHAAAVAAIRAADRPPQVTERLLELAEYPTTRVGASVWRRSRYIEHVWLERCHGEELAAFSVDYLQYLADPDYVHPCTLADILRCSGRHLVSWAPDSPPEGPEDAPEAGE